MGDEVALDETAVIRTYKALTGECNGLVQKLTELETDRNEHRLVEETLKPLDPDRRAFRLVGGVLVERTVGEVLPSVITNRSNVRIVLQSILPFDTHNINMCVWHIS